MGKNIQARENLTILTNSQAVKLGFSSESKRVNGVHIVSNDKVDESSDETAIKENTSFIEAGEVILCGGAINSPQLLLLSGKKEIKKKKIF